MAQKPTKITHLVVLGDSLSDRGTLNKRELLGFIPMSYLSGLRSKSPKGRFTNGFLWGDYVGATTAEQFEIEHIRRKLRLHNNARDNADIGDELLINDKARRENENSFSLNEDNHILFKGERFARFYCEGGLTSHDYSCSFTFNLVLFFTRLILATLGGKRTQLLADDKKYNISNLEKSETLVVEWSGANDLITANDKPSRAAAEKAVNDRIQNIEALIHNGYRNFVLFNLPNLSLTPRFQRKNAEEQRNASDCTEYFNKQLQTKSLELIKKYKELGIPVNLSVFDVNEQFKEVYSNPEQYGFDRDKLKSPYVESALFKENQKNPIDQKEHISPAKGYMFWDDVHPTATMHDWLAERFKEKYYDKVFRFEPPLQAKHRHKETADALAKTTDSMVKTDKPVKKLPEDIVLMLNAIHSRAQLMCQSTDAQRREKGELLKHFIFEIKCQHGNLENIYGLISAFTLNPDHSKIIKTHQNPMIDFFRNKVTTRSEDDIAALQKAVATYLQPKESNEHLVKLT